MRYESSRALAASLLDEALGLLLNQAHCPWLTEKRRSLVGRPPAWDRQKIMQALDDFTIVHGRMPTYHEWREPGRHAIPAYATIRANFGSQHAAYAAFAAWQSLRHKETVDGHREQP